MVQRSVVGALEGGPYARVELDRGVYRDAERLLLDRRDLTLRAADALHLALARAARAGTLATFDGRLGAAARALGLGSYPPGGSSRS
jgi:predicted nucleic acid-binding protein